MNDAEWEEAVDILSWHYDEEMKDEELGSLRKAIGIKDRKIEALEERIEYQRKVICSLRNKNSQLIGDIRKLLDERENQWLHCC